MGFDHREDKQDGNVGGRGRKLPSRNHQVRQLEPLLALVVVHKGIGL